MEKEESQESWRREESRSTPRNNFVPIPGEGSDTGQAQPTMPEAEQGPERRDWERVH